MSLSLQNRLSQPYQRDDWQKLLHSIFPDGTVQLFSSPQSLPVAQEFVSSFIDHTGAIRKHFRARWWEAVSKGQVCSDLVFPSNSQIKDWSVTDEAMKMFQPYNENAPPVFVGHYYKSANAAFNPERHNVACLDYSAAVDGPLVAYRWKGEQSMKAENYIAHS